MSTELKPIRSAADYERALADLERLWGAESGTADGDRLDVLATLIDAYEAEHEPIDPPDPIEAIRFRMEQQGLTRKDLGRFIGTRTRVAEVLNRKRGLSIAMIRRLHEGLGIAAEILIRPSRLGGAPDETGGMEAGAAVGRTRTTRSSIKAGGQTSRRHQGASGLAVPLPARQPADGRSARRGGARADR
jgi:HTH-type transcriptional regulator/antitoxin HigA